jgi:hypothetical protein
MAPHPATGVASDRLSCAIYPVAAPSPQCPGRLPPARRSALVPPVSVALNALASDRSVPVRVQPRVATLKPCEPPRYPPPQVERIASHRRSIHTYGRLTSRPRFGGGCGECDSVCRGPPTESSIPARCTSSLSELICRKLSSACCMCGHHGAGRGAGIRLSRLTSRGLFRRQVKRAEMDREWHHAAQFAPARANIRFMFHAMVTRLHSPRTLSRPRNRN